MALGLQPSGIAEPQRAYADGLRGADGRMIGRSQQQPRADT